MSKILLQVLSTKNYAITQYNEIKYLTILIESSLEASELSYTNLSF